MKNRKRFIDEAFALLMLGGRRSLILVVLLAFASAIVEAIGIGSVFPFIAVVTNPAIIEQNHVLRAAFAFAGLDRGGFIFLLGVVFLLMIVLVNMITALNLVMLAKFSGKLYSVLSSSLLKNIMARPYHFFLKANTSEFSAIILSYTRRVSDGIIGPILTLITKGASALLIIGVLIWVSPIVAVSVICMIAPVYGLIYFLVRERLNKLGADIALTDRSCYRVANEALSGIKDLKILDRTSYAATRFEKSVNTLSTAHVNATTLSQIPKYLIETLSVITIVGIILWKQASTSRPEAAISLAAIYAYAGYRLLPAAQAIFSSLSVIKYNADSVAIVAKELLNNELEFPDHNVLQADHGHITMMKESLELKEVTFRYPEEESLSLKSITAQIPAGSHVGFVGPSGAGKSTLLDIVVGLIYPEDGGLYIDGSLLSKDKLANWRKKIGYVPQTVFLSDASISENIAFGIPCNLIDQDKVESAARVAQLHDFIISSLPNGYKTEIGERGIRLSGGQRQRLGIARALYHEPELIILDEATNALDSATEDSFTETIKSLSGTKTIITVAHRLSTVRYCDRIYILKDGSIIAGGNYTELEKSSPDFQELLNASGPTATQ